MLKRLLSIGLVAIGLGHAHTASAQVDYGWTRLVNAAWTAEKGHSGGQCIDVPGGSTQIGTVVAMYPCGNGSNQQFRLKDNSFESSRIAVYEGANERCLSHQDPTTSSPKVFIDSCDKAPKWRTASTGEIATEDLKYCMTIPLDGRPELVANCNPFDVAPKAAFGSSWHISTLGRPYGSEALMVSLGNFACVDVRGGSTTPGASLIHYVCNGTPNQMFALRGLPQQVFISVYKDGQTLCLSNVGVLDAGKVDSTQAVPCNRSDRRQAWNVIGTLGGGGLKFINDLTGRCLDAYATDWWVGSWGCQEVANQRWSLLPLETTSAWAVGPAIDLSHPPLIATDW